jgi:hypothetical protein
MLSPRLRRIASGLATAIVVSACAFASATTVAAAREPAVDGDPPPLTVVTRRPGMAPGLIFTTPQSIQLPTASHGPLISDDRGRPVWFHPLAEGEYATSLRVQTYQGHNVLTWWQGTASNTGIGMGTGYLADENYRIIATVKAPEPLGLHEFRLTPEGTALVVAVHMAHADLTPIGGPSDGPVVESVVYEIDVATGRVLLTWKSLDHVPVTDTDVSWQGGPLDYIHVNSVAVDTDGNLIISGRHTNTVYKVNRHTGEIMWRLGGRHSDFRLGVGVKFQWQHDVVPEGNNVYRMFDNEARPGLDGYESRVLWVKADPKRGVTEFVRQLVHPDLMSTALEGGSHGLPNGNTFVSWGGPPGRISEFGKDGKLLFDATLPERFTSYRAYRFVWHGRPATAPSVTVDSAGTVRATWNGATDVARWRVLGGATASSLQPLAQAPWSGLTTAVPLPTGTPSDLRYVQVQALAANGKALGVSPVTAVTR